ncbi:MAG: bifunctional metallophosphatase/5'-nucleotidase [Candidatus Hodarchaeales archaeon]
MYKYQDFYQGKKLNRRYTIFSMSSVPLVALMILSIFVQLLNFNIANNLLLVNQSPYLIGDVQQDAINLTIFHINDFHGWLDPHDGYGGAATLAGYFKKEGFQPEWDNDTYLLLSGGDQNTGPAIATLSKGEAVIDVMNAMGFDAAAIGNHEFDFGIETMLQQQALANFSILSCNIYDVGTTDLANFTIPWVVQNHSNIMVGIIGLTTTSTYTSAHPKYTEHYDFADYEESLRRFVPEVRDAGAEIIIALTHIPPNQLFDLASEVTGLGIDLFLGGHAGGGTIIEAGNSLIAAANHYGKQYAKIVLSLNNSSHEVVSRSGILIDNIEGGSTPDPEIQDIIDYWRGVVNADEVITYTSHDIYDEYSGLGIGALVTDGFINYFNYSYNFGIANRGGGFRDHFRTGPITKADIVSVIPFENNLMLFNFSGQELVNFIETTHGTLVVSGVRYYYNNSDNFRINYIQIQEKNVWYNLEPDKVYQGLILDYIWYRSYRETFPVIDTGIHYREAVISYFRTIDDLTNHAFDDRYTEGTSWNTTTTSSSSGQTSQESSTTSSTTTPENESVSLPKVTLGFMSIMTIQALAGILALRKKQRGNK